MKSLLPKVALGAALTTLPLISAQPALDTLPARSDLTLLTGPNLLSPPTRPINSPSISSEIVTPTRTISEIEIETALKKRSAAEARLKLLRAERAAALARKKALEEAANSAPLQPATPPRAEQIRFEAQMPATPVELPRKISPTTTPLKRD